MRHQKNLSAALTSCLLSLGLVAVAPNSGQSEINNCDGVLTNRECTSGNVIFQEKPHKELPPELLERRKRESLLLSLDVAISRARRKHNVEIDTSLLRTVCDSSSLEDCQKMAIDKEKELNSLIATKISQPDKKVPEEKHDNSQTVITIIQPIPSHPHHRRRRRPIPEPSPTPSRSKFLDDSLNLRE